MNPILLFLHINTAMALAVPAPTSPNTNANIPPGFSGCYPFADPDCGVRGTFCQCANGHFYLFNKATGNCNPPWGYIGNSEASLPGFNCR